MKHPVTVYIWTIFSLLLLYGCLVASHSSTTIVHNVIKITPDMERYHNTQAANVSLQERSASAGAHQDCETNILFMENRGPDDSTAGDKSNTCALSMECDDPEVRNSYATSPRRHLSVIWYVFVNKGHEDFYNNAESRIAASMATLREHFQNSGLSFSTVVKKLTLVVKKKSITDFSVASKCNAGDSGCYTAETILQAANGDTGGDDNNRNSRNRNSNNRNGNNDRWKPDSATIHVIANRLQNSKINGFAYYPFDPNGILGAVAVSPDAVHPGYSTLSHEFGHGKFGIGF